MLPQFYKIIVVNNSGQTLTYNNNGRINLKITAWIVDPTTLKVTYTQLADSDMAFIAASTIVDGAEIIDDIEHDNTSNLYIGIQVQLEITHDEGAAADGTFDLYVEGGDATGELPSDANGYSSAEINLDGFIGSLTWDSSPADDQVLRSDVYPVE